MKFEDYMNEAARGGPTRDFVEEVAEEVGMDANIVAMWINVMGIDDPNDLESEKEEFVGQLEDISDATETFLNNLVSRMSKQRVGDLTKVK